MTQYDYTNQVVSQLRAALERKLPADMGMPFSVIARKRLKIRTVDAQIVPFELRKIQKRYLAAKRLSRMKGNKPRYLLLKYRRGGFTTVEQGISYYLASRNRNINVVTLAQDGDTTARIFKIARIMHDRDLKAPPIKRDNQLKLEFPGLNSIFYLGTAAGSGVARGDTLSRVHWSEVAWSCPGYNQIEKQRQLLTGLSEAASHGEIVLETTPNGQELFRELYMDAKAGKNDWTPIFLPWHEDRGLTSPIDNEDEYQHIVATIDDEEDRLIRNYGVDAGQLKWRREKKRDLKHLFYQEYPDDDESCWLMSGISFFDSQIIIGLGEMLDRKYPLDMRHDLPMPFESETVPGGYRIIWEEPKPGVEYCAGVDTSEGLPGCDPNGIGIMRRDNGKQVCALHGLFDPRTLADHVCWAWKKYDPLIGIERQNHGHAVIQKVIDNGMSKSHIEGGNLYHHNYANPYVKTDKQVHRAGWNTTSITRPVMLNGLREYICDAAPIDGIINDRHMVLECGYFRLQSDGKFAADSGTHDDCVIKWAVCNQMRSIDWPRRSFKELNVSRFG